MTVYESAFTRPPAPPPLDLVQAFLNSVDLEDGSDEFATATSLAAWIGTHVARTEAAVTEQDRLRAIRFREALRDMVEHGPGEEATRVLQDEMDAIPLILHIDAGGSPRLLASRDGFDVVLVSVMERVYRAMIDGSWRRLKICRNDICRWAFYDASKNHSGVWCSMATCGSQAKARAYRSRTRRKEAS